MSDQDITPESDSSPIESSTKPESQASSESSEIRSNDSESESLADATVGSSDSLQKSATAESQPRQVPVLRVGARPPGTHAPRARVDLNAEDETEIEAMLDEMMSAGLEDVSSQEKPGTKKEGSPSGARIGRVISVSKDDIFVDLGGKSEGVIAVDQFDEIPEPGSQIEVIIDRFDSSEGLLVLRRPGAAQEADWSNIQPGMIVEGRVTQVNNAGLVVDVGGIRAFMPASQIDVVRVPDLQEFLNTSMRCQVSEVNKSAKNVILSRRVLVEVEREEAQKKTWAELAEGQTRTGIVRNIKDFGAFVDLGGVDGLLPVSEIAWTRVEDPNDVLKVGQKLQVKVMKIDPVAKRLSLSLRQLTDSPWQTLEERCPLGCTITGKVTKVAEFGAFVEVEPGIEGLVHISELAHHRVHRVRDVVQEEQEVSAQVMSIDPAARRISLSMKAILDKPDPKVKEDVAENDPEDDRPPIPKIDFPLKGGLER